MTDGEWPRTGSGRGSQIFRHSEGYAVPRGIPHEGRSTPAVDAEGSPSPPSSSRSGDPHVRGRAVRCRYHRGTIWGIPARSARMTAEFEKARRYPQQPGRGLRRRKVRSTLLPPCGEGFARSLAPPSRPKSRRYAAVGLETRLRAQFSAAIRFAGFASEAGYCVPL